MKNILLYLLLGGSVFLVFDSCRPKKEDEPTVNTFDRTKMLTHLADQAIMPAYKDYQSKLATLDQKVTDFETKGDVAALTQLRSAWLAAAKAYQASIFFDFGPAVDYVYAEQSNTFPVDTALILSNIQSGSYNLASISNFDGKGLQAIDYLLYRPDLSDAEIVAKLSQTSELKYLKDCVADLEDVVGAVYSSWSNSYRASFIASATSNSEGSAVSNLLNAFSAVYEQRVRKGKVGLPAGVFNGYSQTPMPGHVEALYSGASITLLETNLEAMLNYFQGVSLDGATDGLGLSDYIDHVEAKKGSQLLSDAIRDQIESAKSATTGISGALSEAVVQNKTAVSALYNEMQELVSLIKVDLTAALGVQITYQDTDGD